MAKKPCCQFDGIRGSVIGSHPNLKSVAKLKFGQLYRCNACGGEWFLAEDKSWLYRQHSETTEALERWSSNRFVLDKEMMRTLLRIGGTRNLYQQSLEFPCAAETKLGQRYARALVVVSKTPPNRHLLPYLHWADELALVESSPLALDPEVRLALASAVEQKMAFVPLGVVDPEGKDYTLTARGHFFEGPGCPGEVLRVSGKNRGLFGWPNQVSPVPPEAYFFVDWSPGWET